MLKIELYRRERFSKKSFQFFKLPLNLPLYYANESSLDLKTCTYLLRGSNAVRIMFPAHCGLAPMELLL